MSQGEVENLENEGGPPLPDSEAAVQGEGEGTSTPTEQAWTPSKEDWEAQQRQIAQMAQYFVEDEVEELEPPPGITPEQMQYFQQLQAAQYQQIAPHLQASVNDAGQRRMNELFDKHESNPEIGKFDRELAQYYAERALNEGERDAVRAVERGAKQAAAYRQQERAEARKELEASLKRRGTGDHEDVSSGAAGERIAQGAKTYEEVIELYQQQYGL